MFKEKTKYKLIGYQPVGIEYSIPRIEIAEWKNNEWYPYGRGKVIVNFVIEKIIEIPTN